MQCCSFLPVAAGRRQLRGARTSAVSYQADSLTRIAHARALTREPVSLFWWWAHASHAHSPTGKNLAIRPHQTVKAKVISAAQAHGIDTERSASSLLP